MKVSLNWIREFTAVDLSVEDLVKKIGAQLGAVEEVIDLGQKYEGIYVAEVVSCDKHPNADKLNVCMIDDGQAVSGVPRNANGYVQVVCGAPNVKAGMLVAWLPPGATVPSTADKEPFVLEAREIRGVVSNGMLASAHELAISDDHSGILEIENSRSQFTVHSSQLRDIKPGDGFSKVFGLDDFVIDIENKMFTHRPDCFGILGVAREVAGITHQQFTSPVWYSEQPQFPDIAAALPVKVVNELPELVPRFMAVPMAVEYNGPSPVWLQAYLMRAGLRPINTIVDITNYVMILTGQPLHAYDYDKIKQLDGNSDVTFRVRKPKAEEKIKLLNGKEITPRADAVMIASDKHLIGVGGVMGGADTEVDENTRRIVIECANFDMYSIRRTAMEHGLFTDAVTRFNKGQSPLQNDRVLAYSVDMVMKLARGEVAGPVVDDNHVDTEQDHVSVTADFVNDRLGLKLSAAEMKSLLQNVEFEVAAEDNSLNVTAPFWRTDIEIAEDVVEEIGRLYGYDHLPLELPKRSLSPPKRNKLFDFKTRLREALSRAGANEILTYSFVHEELLKKVGQDPNNAFKLANAISPDLHYYRMSLLPSLLDKVHPNIKAGVDEFGIFEINQTHAKDIMKDGLPVEEYRVAFVFAAEDKLAERRYGGAAYYQAKHYLGYLLADLGIDAVFEPTNSHGPKFEVGKAALAPFDTNRSAYIKAKDGTLLGEVGEFAAATRRSLKLPRFTAGFELDVLRLMDKARTNRSYTPLSRFPKVQQDMTLKLPKTVAFQSLDQAVREAVEAKAQAQTMTVSYSCVGIFERDNEPTKNVTYRFTVVSHERTLTAGEVNTLLDEVAATLKEHSGAERL